MMQELLKSIKLQIKHNNASIQSIEAKLHRIYTSIEDNELSSHQSDPLIAHTALSNIAEQQCRVDLLNKRYKTQLAHIAKTSAQMTLIQLNQTCSSLLKILQHLGVIITKDNLVELYPIMTKVQANIDELERNQIKLDLNQQKIASFLSKQDMESEKNGLMQSIEKLRIDLTCIEERIEHFPYALLPNHKTLEIQYREHINPKAWIDEKESELDEMRSNFNLSAWYDWFFDVDKYKKNVVALQLEIDFLGLLYTQATLKTEISNLEERVKHFGTLLDKTPQQLASDRINQIIEDTQQILATLHLTKQNETAFTPTELELSTEKLKMNLFSQILDSMTEIPNLIAKNTQALVYLEKLVRLSQQMTSLQMQYQLIETLEPDAIDFLKKEVEEKSKYQAFLKQQMASCRNYFEIYSEYTLVRQEMVSLKKQQHEVEQEIKTPKKKINASAMTTSLGLSTSFVDPPHKTGDVEFGMARDVKSGVAVVAESGVTSDVKSEKAWNLVAEQFADAESQNPREFGVGGAVANRKSNPFEIWDNKIRELFHHIPIDIQLWYENVLTMLMSHASTGAQSLQACQLLRDIHFEALHPNNQWAVIGQYMQLCPLNKTETPVTLVEENNPFRLLEQYPSLHTLLNLKPAFSIDDKSLPIVKDGKINDSLQLLYLQCKKLEIKHPCEAELLTQATRVLHQSALQIEQFSQSPGFSLQNLLIDSRYDRLKRHRGLLKIWEKIEDCIHWLTSIFSHPVGKQNKQHFCFFNTRTVKLLEDAEQKVKSLHVQTVLGAVDNSF